jgi:hypothetical protein
MGKKMKKKLGYLNKGVVSFPSSKTKARQEVRNLGV